jgi:taurine transport system permease protein
VTLTSRLLNSLWRGFGPFIPLLLIWQVGSMLSLWPEQFMPAPARVAATFVSMSTQNDLMPHVWTSLSRVAVAGFIGTAVALLMGILISSSRQVAAALEGLIYFLQAVGEVGWLPLLVLWSGFNNRTILISVGYTVFFPVFFGTLTGFLTIPKNLKDSIRTLGGNQWHILWEVMLPGALPSIITGFRTGVGFGWRTVILAEMLVGEQGLGVMMFRARELFRVDWILVGMVIAGLIWLITDELILRPLEARTIERWGLVR